jgi:hypothetical protein
VAILPFFLTALITQPFDPRAFRYRQRSPI